MSRLMIHSKHVHNYRMIWHLTLSEKRLKRKVGKNEYTKPTNESFVESYEIQDAIFIQRETLL